MNRKTKNILKDLFCRFFLLFVLIELVEGWLSSVCEISLSLQICFVSDGGGKIASCQPT